MPGSPAWKVEQIILSRARVTFVGRVTELRAQLAAHYDRMIAALGL